MHTREELTSIKNLADPQRRMIYITEPYTSMVEDAMMLSEEAARATVERSAEEAALLYNIAARDSIYAQNKNVPEIQVGSIIAYVS